MTFVQCVVDAAFQSKYSAVALLFVHE